MASLRVGADDARGEWLSLPAGTLSMTTRISVVFVLVSLAACDNQVVEPDAGLSMDASSTSDGGRDAGALVEDGGVDAGPSLTDGGPACGAAQHLCDGVCTNPMANEPSNGCRLGCGDPCPGGAEAVCNADGTCGIRGCTPMTCEDLSVECGTTDNGCGTPIGCGACTSPLRCESNLCVCDGDPHEVNDTSGAPTILATLTDDPDSSISITNATIHRTGDIDWFQVNVDNAGFLGDPEVTVSLSGIPSGEDYDLGAWYFCSDTSTPGPCTSGMFDTSLGSGGCISNAVGPDTVAFDTNCDPDGVLLIRVRPFAWGGDCGAYRLDVAIN